MLVISGSINSSRPGIDRLIADRDREALLAMVRDALRYGADVISVNCGTRFSSEADDVEWMVRTIMEVFDVPMCIDSPDPEVQAVGLSRVRTARPVIDSITADPARMDAFLPLAERYGARVIALAMDEESMPKSAEDKLAMVRKMKDPLRAAHIPFEDVYLDPLLFPVATDAGQGAEALRAIRMFKQEEPEFKVCMGLDNISHGLPARGLLSRTFLAMAAGCGLDATFIVLDEQSKPLLVALDTLSGNDPFCQRYLQAYRDGTLGE